MDIRDTINYFSRQVFLDAYTGISLFTGHFDIYNGWLNDGVSSKRRAITISPTAVVPTRRCIKQDADVFIVGEVVPDYINNEIIKNHLICQASDGLMEVKTSAELLLGTAKTLVYFGKSWRKSWKDLAETAEIFNIYNLYIAISEPTPDAGNIAVVGNKLFRINSVEESTGGFTVLLASDLGADAIQTVLYSPMSGGYNPVSDTKLASAPFPLSVIWEMFQTTFKKLTPSTEKFLPSDRIVTAATVDLPSPKLGDKLTLLGIDYGVIGVSLAGTSNKLHVRPV